MKMIDLFFRCSTCKLGAERNGNTVFVRAADIEHIISLKPLETGVAVSREVSACDMAKMELPICIGKSRCDQNLFRHFELQSLLLAQPYLGELNSQEYTK